MKRSTVEVKILVERLENTGEPRRNRGTLPPSMFPTWPFMGFVTVLAAGIASAFNFSGLLGFIKNLVISILVLYGFVAAGVLLGLIFHNAIFGTPTLVD